MKKIILILLIVIIGLGVYGVTRDNSKNQKKPVEINPATENKEDLAQPINLYRNTSDEYEIELPYLWNTTKEGSTVFAFPSIEKKEGVFNIEETYTNNTVGISITTLASGISKEKIDSFYSKMFGTLKTTVFANVSGNIVEIKSEVLETSDPEDPTYGYKGTSYAIKTTKRVYAINIFYKDLKDKPTQEQNIAKIITSLKEE